MAWVPLLPLVACVASSVLATFILSRDSTHGTSRLSAGLLYGAAFWAFCEVAWTGVSEADTALALVKLSALGWVALGPMGLHLVIEVMGEPALRTRRTLPVLYTVSALFLAIDWATPWIHPRVVETAWGWGYELGPAYPFFWLFTVSSMLWGLFLGVRAYPRLPSAAERRQACWIGAGIVVPLSVASVTDGILPFLGIQVVHLGTPSFVVLGVAVGWSLHRYGYALLIPAAWSWEIVETMREGLVMLRLDGHIRTANGAMARLAGCARRELAGVRIQDLVQPDPLAASGLSEVECRLTPVSGSPIPVSLSTSELRDRQGEPSGFAVVIRDQREVMGLRERLILSGRMAAVGQLAAGIAHEINNPVAYVRANLVQLRRHWELLRGRLRPGAREADCDKDAADLCGVFEEGLEVIDESLEGVARTEAIVRGIREFSHAGGAQRAAANLNALVDAARRMAAPRLRRVAEVAVDYGELPPLECSPGEIQQVILNLLVNAADALGEGGRISVSTRYEDDALVVAVNDDGSGISADALQRIFDPFFTTKDVGEGTGLGLAISYEIVARHGGEIDVDSRPGAGTTFTVRLPLEPPAAAQVASAGAPAERTCA